MEVRILSLFRTDQVYLLTHLRWVYIIEGIFSIAIGIAVWFGLPTNPAEAYFLNAEEKEMMRIRYAQEKQYLGSENFSWEEVWIEFKDPKLYLSGCIQFCQASPPLHLYTSISVTNKYIRISFCTAFQPSCPRFSRVQVMILSRVTISPSLSTYSAQYVSTSLPTSPTKCLSDHP